MNFVWVLAISVEIEFNFEAYTGGLEGSKAKDKMRRKSPRILKDFNANKPSKEF